MSNLIFLQKYDSESIVDMGRDISEAFSLDFNPNVAKIQEGDNYHVLMTFSQEPDNNNIQLLSKQYYDESLNDIEEDAYDAFGSIEAEPNDDGFFEGTITLTITTVPAE